MKKLFFSDTVLLLASTKDLHAQWYSVRPANNDIYNTNSGNVGIGTTAPVSALHIGGDNFLTMGDYSGSQGTKGISITGWRDNTANFFGASIEAVPVWICCTGYLGVKVIGLDFNIHTPGDWTGNAKTTAMSINSNGNVLIGSVTGREAIPTC